MFLNPERDARYRDLSYLITIPVAVLSFAAAVWALCVLSIWVALPVAVVVLSFGFIVVLKLLNRVLPQKFPADRAL
jgi:hypothetical protein